MFCKDHLECPHSLQNGATCCSRDQPFEDNLKKFYEVSKTLNGEIDKITGNLSTVIEECRFESIRNANQRLDPMVKRFSERFHYKENELMSRERKVKDLEEKLVSENSFLKKEAKKYKEQAEKCEKESKEKMSDISM